MGMMKRNDSEKVLLQKNFIAGTYNLTHTTNRLWKLEGGAIFFCRQGTASVNVDLKDYQLTPQTVAVLMPGTIFRLDRVSDDFTTSLSVFPWGTFHGVSFG